MDEPSDPSRQTHFILANTTIVTPPLCPEIKLHLLREKAPVWGAEPHIFAPEGPRPYWAFAWASGQALARYLMDHPDSVRGKRILDCGAGSGIAAIGAAMAGAASVLATDIDPTAVRAIELNARENEVAVAASEQDRRDIDARDWDVLLAADIFYEADGSGWLPADARGDRLVLVADPPGRGFPRERLCGVAVYRARTVPEIEHPSLTKATVYRLL